MSVFQLKGIFRLEGFRLRLEQEFQLEEEGQKLELWRNRR